MNVNKIIGAYRYSSYTGGLAIGMLFNTYVCISYRYFVYAFLSSILCIFCTGLSLYWYKRYKKLKGNFR